MLAGVLGAGCHQTHVAGFIEAVSGDATTTTDATDDGPCMTSPCADDSTGSLDCAPSPLSPCTVGQDPLRAMGVACFEGVSNTSFTSPDPDAWRTPHEFGNSYWVSSDNEAILAISTGRLSAPTPSGLVTLDPGVAHPGSANDNPDGVDAPPPIDIAPGSNGGAGGSPFVDCDGAGDCSDTLQSAWTAGAAHDLAWLSFDASVPANASGYAVRVALLTAEYPERVGAANSDTFVWWAASESYTGNLATLDTAPFNVAAIVPYITYGGDHPAMLRTGMDGFLTDACTDGSNTYDPCPTGAATSWLELRGPAVPGETVSIVAALFDQVDDLLDTTVLLDAWQWRCDGCTPGIDCGLHPLPL